MVRWWNSMSLASRGVRIQFAVALVLTCLIPLCVLAYVITNEVPEESASLDVLRVLTAFVFFTAVLGTILIIKYPVDILRLRRYLEDLAGGVVPREVRLVTVETDLAAIERYMSLIVEQTEERIRTIERQTSAMVENERQRVVIESLGAACHHLGQPATVLATYLRMLETMEATPEVRRLIAECRRAAEEIAEILRRLQRISEYHTEPYLPEGGTNGGERPSQEILKI